MRPINVGIIGLGTVGASVAKMILTHGEDYKRYYGLDIRLIAAAALDDTAVKELGIEDVFTFDGNDVIDNPDVDVVIELIGGTGIAKKFVLKALNAGKHVVTANKAIMASCGEEILKTAQANGVSIMYGASVGGGIPIIGPLKRSLDCNEISDVMGIVNGTTNYMLTRMSDDGMDYEAALKEAQEKGFAEFNPAGDVEGLDAANKIAILASIAFHSRVTIEDVYVEGITKIEPIDLDVARDMGYCIKLLAIARRTENGIDVRVHPTMLPLSHPLAGVNGVFNAIYVVGDFVGETMFFGQGAGGGAAASAVMGDLLEIARMLNEGFHETRWCECIDEIPILPIDELESEYYLRIQVEDRPGVFAKIAEIFAKDDISFRSVNQRETIGDLASITVLTHITKESAIRSALEEIVATGMLAADPMLIRISR